MQDNFIINNKKGIYISAEATIKTAILDGISQGYPKPKLQVTEIFKSILLKDRWALLELIGKVSDHVFVSL